ncbi:MAG: GTPase Era [Magnetococcales bacterium]|nr:GTPase Era [Magnetococcales bacterium]
MKKGKSTGRSGFIAITGRPNAGKSTFLNQVVGQKIAIVTPKAQTTRSRIVGIVTRPRSQMVFLDTPGIHTLGRTTALNRAMVATAFNSCHEVDLILYMIDAVKGLDAEDQNLLSQLPGCRDKPLLLLVNKIDRLAQADLLQRLSEIGEQIKQSSGWPAIAEVIPLSAMRGYNLPHLLDVLERYLPKGPHYFPADQITDQPEHFLVAEIIREKLFLLLQQELPYSLAVQVEQFSEEPSGLLRIAALIVVARPAHRPIVIGHRGQLLKKVGEQARLELEQLFATRIHLQLWVKVDEGWSDNRQTLQELGYPMDP